MLSKAEKDYLIELIEQGKEIPKDFKYKLFPVEQKEYELAYAGKMRKEDLLADDDGSFPVPLQAEKTFNNGEHADFADGWKNMIVFGDNLQFLKSVYKNEDPIIKDKVKGKVKLIYILAFVNENDIDEINIIIESFDEIQKHNLKLLMGLIRKSANKNKYFDHMSCNYEQGERVRYLISTTSNSKEVWR